MTDRPTPSVVPDDGLLPCPFCGKQSGAGDNGPGKFFIYCTNDECFVQPETGWFKNHEDAVAKWNTRVAASDRDVLVEALVDIRNSILCPVGPTPTLDEIVEKASAALIALKEEL